VELVSEETVAGRIRRSSVAAALVPWLGSRTVATAIVLPAAALLAYEMLSEMPSDPLTPRADTEASHSWILVAMSALAALSGGPARLPRSWLSLPCVPLAGVAAWGLLRSSGEGHMNTGIYLPEYAILLLAAVVTCWFVTDARPAFGLITAVLLTFLLYDVGTLPSVLISTEIPILVVVVLPLAIGLAIMLALAWLLHRQAASSPRPLPRP